jgi:hypothetical protein
MTDTDPTKNHETLNETFPETSPERQATFEKRDFNHVYELLCGDERKLSQGSAKELGGETEEVESFLRYFGGLAGVGRVLILTLLAEGKYGEVEARFSGTYGDVLKKIKSDVEATEGINVSLDLHSADHNEGGEHFHADSEEGVGCAYCANIAIISGMCADSAEKPLATQPESGWTNNTTTANINQSNGTFRAMFFASNAAGMTRQDYVLIGAPVGVLKGNHAKAEETVAVINFTADKVSNPNKAVEGNVPFYGNDVTQIAEMLIRTYPELNLNPEAILTVMEWDVRATRAALAGGDASAIKQERLGDPQEAITYLRDLQVELAQAA